MSARLRVGLVYDDTIDRVGGIGLYVTTLGAELSRRGHTVAYLLGSSCQRSVGGVQVHALARNVHVRFNGNRLSMPAWSRGRDLRRTLELGDFDVLHVQAPYSPLMAGRLMRRCSARCAVVGTYHVASTRWAPRAGARALRLLVRRSDRRIDRMVAVSDTAAEFAMRFSRVGVDHVLPNLLDIEGLRRDRHAGGPSADIVFVGRLVPRKGVEHLVRAVRVIACTPGVATPTVAVLGDGPLRGRLEALVHRLDLTDVVKFYGHVDHHAKVAALSRARVSCFPSLFGESFGIVVLEAVAAGSDVVLAGDNPGYRELLADERALVDPRDSDVFARTLTALLTDARLRASIRCSQLDLLERCAVGTVVDRVEHVYRDAIAARRRADFRPTPAEATLALG